MFEPGPPPPTEPQGKSQLRGDSSFLVFLWDTSLHPTTQLPWQNASGPRTAVLVALPREDPFPQSCKHKSAIDTHDNEALKKAEPGALSTPVSGAVRQGLGCAPD